MHPLSDKLKSLGVQIGAKNLTQRPSSYPYPIEKVLGGSPYQTPFGDTYLVEAYFPPDYQHGQIRLPGFPPLDALSTWIGDDRLRSYPQQAFAFLDTETTGLSGGTGTYAFLIGVGRFEGDTFHLAQFFMRDPAEEPAQLAALEDFLAPCQALVSYNGKSFDLPILMTRYLFHGWRPPFTEYSHIDLLYLVRRLWKDRLLSRALTAVEVEVLGATRTVDDVPGWMIPELFFQYLHSGDARPMKRVFYHNSMDVLSLAALFHHSARLLAAPLTKEEINGTDLRAMARFFETIGETDTAIALYNQSLQLALPNTDVAETLFRLAMLYKRINDYAQAIPTWERCAKLNHLDACIELAKYYEHRQRDFARALYWTEAAMEMLFESSLTPFEKGQWIASLEHRQSRLRLKLHRRSALSNRFNP